MSNTNLNLDGGSDHATATAWRNMRKAWLTSSLVGTLLACSEVAEPSHRTCLDRSVIEAYAELHPELPLVRQTEHLDIYADEGFFVCAGMAAELERHTVFVADQLGIEQLRTPIEFYYTADFPEICSPTAAGCTLPDGAAFGVPTTAYHELTHAVACELRIDGVLAYVEGVATMFEHARRGHQSYMQSSLEDVLTGSKDNASHAGHFLRWLLERDGGAALADVYAASAGYPQPLEVEPISAILHDVYGADLGQLSVEYLETAPFAWVPLRQCADVPWIERQNGEWRLEGTMDCDSIDTFGPYERPYELSATAAGAHMYQSFLFEIDSEGTFSVEIAGASHVRFSRCAERHAEDESELLQLFDSTIAHSVDELPTESVTLTPGLWRADVLQPHASPGPYSVIISDSEGL